MILLNAKYEIEVESCEKDNHGRLTFLDTNASVCVIVRDDVELCATLKHV